MFALMPEAETFEAARHAHFAVALHTAKDFEGMRRAGCLAPARRDGQLRERGKTFVGRRRRDDFLRALVSRLIRLTRPIPLRATIALDLSADGGCRSPKQGRY